MYEKLIKRLRSATTLPAMNALCQEAADAIEELADINVGKWINPRPDSEMCSACGTRFYISALFAVGGNTEPNYCPNCGADMRGEQR